MPEQLKTARSKYVQNRRRFAPHLVQMIELANRLGKDMDDDVSVVDKQPARIGSALDVMGFDSELTYLIANPIGERNQVTITRRGRDDKVIREIGCLSHVQDDDIFRLRFDSPIGNLPC